MKKEIRRTDRAVTEFAEVEQIIQNAKILHLGLIDGNFPYIVPLHYGYEYNSDTQHWIFYMHGAKVGHKLDLIRTNNHACIELETDVELDSGEDIPCRYGSFYSSVIGQGMVSIVSDFVEKKHGLELLMKNQTNRVFAFTETMVHSVAVIKVDVAEYTAKARKRLQ